MDCPGESDFDGQEVTANPWAGGSVFPQTKKSGADEQAKTSRDPSPNRRLSVIADYQCQLTPSLTSDDYMEMSNYRVLTEDDDDDWEDVPQEAQLMCADNGNLATSTSGKKALDLGLRVATSAVGISIEAASKTMENYNLAELRHRAYKRRMQMERQERERADRLEAEFQELLRERPPKNNFHRIKF